MLFWGEPGTPETQAGESSCCVTIKLRPLPMTLPINHISLPVCTPSLFWVTPLFALQCSQANAHSLASVSRGAASLTRSLSTTHSFSKQGLQPRRRAEPFVDPVSASDTLSTPSRFLAAFSAVYREAQARLRSCESSRIQAGRSRFFRSPRPT